MGRPEEYNRPGPGEDVFAFWERELQGRKLVRRQVIEGKGLPVGEPERDTLDILFRALFLTGQRAWFYQFLLQHSDRMPVIRWFASCPDGVKRDFLGRLPFLLLRRPGQRNLDFLINIYDRSLEPAYRGILAVLNQQEIERLMARTANPELRRLLRERRDGLVACQRKENLGLDPEKVRVPGLNCLFGNKVELARGTLACLRQARVNSSDHPYGYYRLAKLCDSLERMYRLGWLEDSVVLLVEVYQDLMARSRMAVYGEASEIYRRLDRLARAVIPLYCLLEFSQQPYHAARGIYRACLMNLTPDGASLAYLSFYEELQEAGVTRGVYPGRQAAVFCRRVSPARPDDRFVMCLQSFDPVHHEPEFEVLMESARERMKTRPHEAFVIMELLRGLVAGGYVHEGFSTACKLLLAAYLDLWYWVPSSRFFNRALVETLAPGLPEDLRRQASGILHWTANGEKGVLDFYRRKPSLAKRQENPIALEVLIGKLLGVR